MKSRGTCYKPPARWRGSCIIVDRTCAPAGEGIWMQVNADTSSTSYSKADKRPVLSCIAQVLLDKYGSQLFGGGPVKLVRT